MLGHRVPDELPAALPRTGVIPDRPHLHRYLTVRDALEFHAAFYPTWDGRWAEQLLGEFRLIRGQVIAGLSTRFATDPRVLVEAWMAVRDIVDGHYMAVPEGIRPEVAAAFLAQIAASGT